MQGLKNVSLWGMLLTKRDINASIPVINCFLKNIFMGRLKEKMLGFFGIILWYYPISNFLMNP
jgi:hypothetical protein